MTQKAAIYCRISDDREGTGLGVKRQESDCRTLAEKSGWEIFDIYVDNDISAYSGKKRPEYMRMMRDIKSGRVNAIIAWHPDRLHRSPKELEEFITECDIHSVKISTAQSGFYDLSTPSGRVTARILGDMARYESEHKSERVKRKALENALEGKVWGRSQRPFGFEANYIDIRESEAIIIREMADRFLAGESMNSLVKSLHEREIKTSQGLDFRHKQLRSFLYGPRWSGRREHHGKIVAKAEWGAIIDPDKQDIIRKILDAPERKSIKSVRRYLLSGGIAVCGTCGEALIAHPKEGVRRYICRRDGHPSTKSCGKMYIKAEWVEEAVTEGLMLRLANPTFFVRMSERNSKNSDKEKIYAEFISLKNREIELGEMFADGTMNKVQFQAAQKRLAPQIEAMERILAKHASAEVAAFSASQAKDALKNWGNLSLEQQRAVVKLVLDKVVITKGRAGFNKLDLSRIQPVWKF